jgi:signal transduction histidine kinase/ligand-binding sensor domain-containing protein
MVPLLLSSCRRSIPTRFAILIFLFLLVPLSAPAQLRSLDVSQYLHTSWTAQDGYFRGVGSRMAQTDDGYIWFLGFTGPLRFDGVRFVEWTPSNGESLPGKPPSALLKSRDGSLWLAGFGLGELKSDGTFHRYHELDNSSLVNLAEGNDGVVWVGVGNRSKPDSCSLFRIEHGKAECYRRPEFEGLNFVLLYVDSTGSLWADAEVGIWRIFPGPPKLMQKTTSRIGAFGEDSQGTLLYTSNGPVWKLSAEGRSEAYLETIEGAKINGRAVSRDSDGGLWIGTSGEGIVHVHEGRIDHFSTLDGLSSNFVQSIFQDREGNVWTMSPNGIDKFTKPAVPKLTTRQGLSNDSVVSVLTDRRGRTWVGTDNGLNELVAGDSLQPSLKFRDRPALALAETNAGSLLVATHDRDKSTVPNYSRVVRDGGERIWLESQKAIFAVAEDDDGTLWAASRDLGLLHLRQNGDVIKAFSAEKFGDYPLSVAFDQNRKGIWFTTHEGNLYFLKDDEISERYGSSVGLGYGPVRILHEDNDQRIWLATRRGLAQLEGGHLSILGSKNGLPCDAVHWMQRDDDHNVWLLTECGLVGFSESDLLAWSNQSSHVVTLTHSLDNTDGVENAASGGWFTPLSAMTKDGRILFAMRTGLGVLDPRHTNENALSPPVHIEEIIVDGHETGNSSHASLPAKTGSIHIAYTALSFAAPRKVRFRYKLQGFDKEWSPPVSLREVTYTNLPPGDYSFSVIASNNSGVWNDKGATAEFTILPAFYQTRSFLILCAIALIGLFWLGLRWRVKRVAAAIRERAEVRADERVRIARDLHDTLLQGVQGLMLHFHVAAQELPEGSRTRASMERALQTADHILIEGRDRVTRLRTNDLTHADLAQAFEAIAADLDHEQVVRFSVKIEGRAEDVIAPVLHEFYYIGREAIGNAFRHSKASEITASLRCGPKTVEFVVADNGCGFDPFEQQTNPRSGHWGLPGMKERSEAIGAVFKCLSKPSKGTQVMVAVTARRAYRTRSSTQEITSPRLESASKDS